MGKKWYLVVAGVIDVCATTLGVFLTDMKQNRMFVIAIGTVILVAMLFWASRKLIGAYVYMAWAGFGAASQLIPAGEAWRLLIAAALLVAIWLTWLYTRELKRLKLEQHALAGG